MGRISIFCFAFLIILLLLGEQTLGLFGGDRTLAARATVVAVTLLGGIGFAFAQPSIWGWFTDRLQRLIRAGGSQTAFAQALRSPQFRQRVQHVVMVISVIFAIGSCGLAVYLWGVG